MTPVPTKTLNLTILILIVGAALGALLALILAFMIAAGAVASTGPFGWLTFGPLLLATFGAWFGIVLIATPLWALVGGYLFATIQSGNGSPAAMTMGVQFFSETHPISQAARQMTDRLQIAPVRHIGWYDADEINAFASGVVQEHALMAFSKGAVEGLTKPQLDAVIAHEIGHIVSHDMQRMSHALGIREALTFFLVFSGFKKVARWVFTPFSELELLRFSRQREFAADAVAAYLTSPEDVISVLTVLRDQPLKPATKDQALVMMSAEFSNGWLSTHPPLEARIAALEKLKQGSDAFAAAAQGATLLQEPSSAA